jgi:hypothetical protein
MIYADPIIMYEVSCPRCKIQIILFREDLDHLVQCDQCLAEFQASLPSEEVGELIYDRTG